MTDGYSGAESVLSLSQGRSGNLKHSFSYSLCVLPRLSGNGGVLCVLKTHSSSVRAHDRCVFGCEDCVAFIVERSRIGET
jgi:hypothetical protein